MRSPNSFIKEAIPIITILTWFLIMVTSTSFNINTTGTIITAISGLSLSPSWCQAGADLVQKLVCVLLSGLLAPILVFFLLSLIATTHLRPSHSNS